jgi:hypothetical protein
MCATKTLTNYELNICFLLAFSRYLSLDVEFASPGWQIFGGAFASSKAFIRAELKQCKYECFLWELFFENQTLSHVLSTTVRKQNREGKKFWVEKKCFLVV